MYLVMTKQNTEFHHINLSIHMLFGTGTYQKRHTDNQTCSHDITLISLLLTCCFFSKCLPSLSDSK